MERKMGLFVFFLIIMCNFDSEGRVMARDNRVLGYPKDEHRELHLDDDGKEVKKILQAEHDNNVHKEISALRLHSMDADGVHKSGHVHMSHMDPSLNVFLIEKDLKVGNKMLIYFPIINPSSSPHFLPRKEADSIPFSSDKLPYLLHYFSFSSGSPQAKAMDNTLRQCELATIEGEIKLCATSLESMLDFASGIFGVGTEFKAVRTIHHRKPTPTSQTHPLLHNYTILNISRELSAGKMVACHTMPYPYTIFYCHHQESKSKVFKVSVISEYDEQVNAVVVCHMDTSQWDADHVSFRMLAIKPGTDPICHFFPEDHLVWVPSTPSV